MTRLKFSLTSQCQKTTILRIVFKNKKVNLSNDQSMQAPCKQGEKTAPAWLSAD